MPCNKPIRAYAAAGSGRIKFWKKTDPQYWIEPYTGLEIPCQVCILCREEHARQTAVRLTHEASLWPENGFLTLTLDDKHLPEHNSLDYEPLVRFWKRLRKKYGKLRYYAVGEYGDDSGRPHYHAILFGKAFVEGRIILRTKPTMLWTHPDLEKAWGMGNVSVGAVTFETARYTASYVLKKLRAKQQYVRVDEETGELIPLVQPRAFMSRNLAKEWWERWKQQTIDHDYVIIDGHKHKPPKAYDKWLKEKDPTKMEEIKNKRRSKAKKLTPDETRARASNAHARVKQKKKTI